MSDRVAPAPYEQTVDRGVWPSIAGSEIVRNAQVRENQALRRRLDKAMLEHIASDLELSMRSALSRNYGMFDMMLENWLSRLRSGIYHEISKPGRWVLNEDMSPDTNVADRLYRTEITGDVFRWWDQDELCRIIHPPYEWWFPDEN